MQILKAEPESVLWLQAEQPVQQANLCHTAAQNGLDPNRLIFAPRVEKRDDHFRRYHLMDVFLNTHYFGAQSTFSEPLLYGVPIITYPLDEWIGRSPIGILSRMGMTELLANDWPHYIELAIQLGTAPDYRNRVRHAITNYNIADIFGPKRWMASFENGLQRIFENYRKGKPFEDIRL